MANLGPAVSAALRPFASPVRNSKSQRKENAAAIPVGSDDDMGNLNSPTRARLDMGDMEDDTYTREETNSLLEALRSDMDKSCREALASASSMLSTNLLGNVTKSVQSLDRKHDTRCGRMEADHKALAERVAFLENKTTKTEERTQNGEIIMHGIQCTTDKTGACERHLRKRN